MAHALLSTDQQATLRKLPCYKNTDLSHVHISNYHDLIDLGLDLYMCTEHPEIIHVLGAEYSCDGSLLVHSNQPEHLDKRVQELCERARGRLSRA